MNYLLVIVMFVSALSDLESEFWLNMDMEHEDYRKDMIDAFDTAFINHSITDAILDEVECNSQLCRVSVDHSPESASENEPSVGLLERISGIPPLLNDHLAQTILDSDGQQQMIIYIVRNGQTLPLNF